MWVYFALIAGVLFAAAGIFSPIVWFLFPAVALFALVIAAFLGAIGGTQEAADEAREDSGADAPAEPGRPSIQDPDARRPAHAATGYAHEGQEPGH